MVSAGEPAPAEPRGRQVHRVHADAPGRRGGRGGPDPTGRYQAGGREPAGQGGRGRRRRAAPPLRGLPQPAGREAPAAPAPGAGARRARGRAGLVCGSCPDRPAHQAGLRAAGQRPLRPVPRRRKTGKLSIDRAKVRAAEQRDGKFVVHSNDDTLHRRGPGAGLQAADAGRAGLAHAQERAADCARSTTGRRTASTPTWR